MGSSDRRMTSRLCYNIFRIGSFASDKSLLERVVLAEYLCEEESSIVGFYRPDLLRTIGAAVELKIKTVEADSNTFFPFPELLSSRIDKKLFLQSQLQQPDLFIRAQRGKEDKIVRELNRSNVNFRQIGAQVFALPNGSKLQDLTRLKGVFEVQDWSSQRTIEFIKAHKGEYWWDACAGSGGKALMVLDKFPEINLLVSDSRLSILRNLGERFEQAKVSARYAKKVLDLTTDIAALMNARRFDGIIVDVPCSGSGTWGRTPEMKAHFSEEKLNQFAVLQKRIVTNVLPYLKSGKMLIYITCSIYQKENEDVVEEMAQKNNLQIERMQVLEGYREKADTMFVACLRKI